MDSIAPLPVLVSIPVKIYGYYLDSCPDPLKRSFTLPIVGIFCGYPLDLGPIAIPNCESKQTKIIQFCH